MWRTMESRHLPHSRRKHVTGNALNMNDFQTEIISVETYQLSSRVFAIKMQPSLEVWLFSSVCLFD